MREVAIFAGALVLAACTSNPLARYKATAGKMSYGDRRSWYHPEWRPIGKDDTFDPSPDERRIVGRDVESCIGELSQKRDSDASSEIISDNRVAGLYGEKWLAFCCHAHPRGRDLRFQAVPMRLVLGHTAQDARSACIADSHFGNSCYDLGCNVSFQMNSKVVNSYIKRRIWTRLKEAGFGVFTARTAWRHHEDRIDVLNFQSFNSYNADVIGCTTYSFSVNLGCFLKAIPPQFEPHRIKSKAGEMLPREFDCHFRGRLSRTFEQPELKQRDIWYIDPGEKYLGWVMTDVEGQLPATALPWFDNFANGAFALQVLRNADEEMGELWGFGRNPSPVRHYFTGYVALGANQSEMANRHLSLALASGCFKSIESRLLSDIQRTNISMHATREDTRA